jgi:hypothetical protein
VGLPYYRSFTASALQDAILPSVSKLFNSLTHGYQKVTINLFVLKEKRAAGDNLAGLVRKNINF